MIFYPSMMDILIQPTSGQDNLAEAFGLETPPRSATVDASALLSFPQLPPSSSSSSSSLATPVLENSTQPGSSTAAQAPSSSSGSSQPAAFPHTSLQTPEVPAPLAPPAPPAAQHYTPAPPPPANSAPTPTAPSASNPASTSAVTTEAAPAPSAVLTHTVPLAGSAGLAPAPTITIAPTQSLVMSDQNLQWILSSAANAQHNSEQQGPKVEKVFFTTAIPVGGHSGNPVQQIGLSLPVIIIKQEEACQCQCACRDSAKERSSGHNAASSQKESTDISPAPPPPPPPPPPPSMPPPATQAAPQCCSSKAGAGHQNPSASTQTFQDEAGAADPPGADGLAGVDVSDLLSPDTTANIEALLMVADHFPMSEGGGSA